MRIAPLLVSVVAIGSGVGAPGSHAVAQDRTLSADWPEVYRVGGMNAPEWAFFEDSARAAFDAAGNLYVLDASAGRVLVIDPEGGLARVTGRRGEGPGELNLAMDLVVWRDGRLAVSDMGHAAYLVFNASGEFEQAVRMSAGRGPMAMFGGLRTAVRPDPLGGALIAQGAFSGLSRMGGLFGRMMGDTADAGNSGVDDRGLERLALDGDVVSSSPVLRGWRVPLEQAADELTASDVADPSAMMAMMFGDRPFFEPGFHWDLLPDGTIAYSDSSAYAIKFAAPDGPVTDVIVRPLSPEPVTGRIREDMIAHALNELEEQSDDPRVAEASAMAAAVMPGMMRAMREATENREFLDEIPVVRGVRATWDGGLWIQRRGEDPWDDDGPIDVFDATREYVGTLAPSDPGMPEAFGPDGLVLHWELDELDVPILVVKRLPAEVR